METRFKLLTWDIEEECIFSRNFRKYTDAIRSSQTLSLRQVNPHDVLNIIKTKKTGHRWELAVWDIDKPQKLKYIYFYSKKDAIFAIKIIKEYDSTLKFNLIKKY